MNTREYIESGKLESYLLGTSTSEESQEAECMARIFPEVQKEMDSIWISIEKYATAFQVEPPADLKNKIFKAIEKHEFDSISEPERRSKIIPIANSQKKNNSLNIYWIAASLILFIISIVSVVQVKKFSNEIALQKYNNENNQLEILKVQQKFEESKQKLTVISDPLFQPVHLKGLEISPDSKVTIYWNQSSNLVYLDVLSLPTPASGTQYQLWGIVEGKPVDLGVFEIPDDPIRHLDQMKSISKASTFAITLEKTGGSAIPTLEKMFVAGNI